jgi:hypothetical protein
MRNKTDTRYRGFAGQIVTTEYDKLKEWANTENKPQQYALAKFLEIAKRDYKIKTINKSRSSYTLKHVVERVSDALVQLVDGYQYEYIGNEDFIIAALQHGFDVKNCRHGATTLSPNYYFNLSEEMFKEHNLRQIVNECIADAPIETEEHRLALKAMLAKFKVGVK